jgi:hypothetical protein
MRLLIFSSPASIRLIYDVRSCPRRRACTPAAASSPKAEPPEESTSASIAWTVFSGASRSVSRVPGPPPRTSTAATAAYSNRTTVTPERKRESSALPTWRPATSVIRLSGPVFMVSPRRPGAVLLGLLVAIASPQICDALGISPWRCLARAALSLRWFVA